MTFTSQIHISGPVRKKLEWLARAANEAAKADYRESSTTANHIADRLLSETIAQRWPDLDRIYEERSKLDESAVNAINRQ